MLSDTVVPWKIFGGPSRDTIVEELLALTYYHGLDQFRQWMCCKRKIFVQTPRPRPAVSGAARL